MTHISWSIDYAVQLDYFLLEKCYTLNISSMWHEGWPQNVCMSLWPTFHSPVIFPYISKTIWRRNIIPWILVPCDTKSNLKIYLGHCDLHFTVQWFYLISRRLFDREMSYLDFNFHVTRWFDIKIYLGQCDSVWPIFHCSVIFPNKRKTIWWRNFIPGTLIPYDAMINLKI